MRRIAWVASACWLVACADTASKPNPDVSATVRDAALEAGGAALSDGGGAPSAPAAEAGTNDGRDASLESSPLPQELTDAGVTREGAVPWDAALARELDASRPNALDGSVFDSGIDSPVQDSGGGAFVVDAAQPEAVDATSGLAASDADTPVLVSSDAGTVKVVFATSIRYTGSLGGLAGADQICADHALAGELTGQFRAWLSTIDESAVERLVHATVPYVRTDGVMVASDWSDVVDGTLAAAIDRDEQGLSVTGDVWTGTLPDGTAYESDCAGFEEGTNAAVSLCGRATSDSAVWTQNIVVGCAQPLRLYCLQQ